MVPSSEWFHVQSYVKNGWFYSLGKLHIDINDDFYIVFGELPGWRYNSDLSKSSVVIMIIP